MSNYKLRPLFPEDLNRVSEIQSRITGSPRKPFFEKLLAQVTANPKSFISCGVEQDCTLLGFAFTRIQEGDFGASDAVAVLEVIGVAADAQGKGVGRTLLSGIQEQMKKKGIVTLKTQTLWTDRAMTSFFASVGFKLASSQILERDTSSLSEDVAELANVKMDSKWQVHSSAGGNDYDRLSRDRILIRSFKREDLAAIIRIDGKITGQEHPVYFEAKSQEMLNEVGVRISIIAEEGGIVTAFIMARVDFGEFGKIDSEAVIDTIGVHPAYKGAGIGHALLSQLLLNLATLKVESVRTQVSRENFDLQRFLCRCGFGPSQRLVLTKAVS
ncbi:MAG: GNAT family N-acetyltransferase [Deltaproteobacteria bacterium]|nr:GNAT family N-acetyltransferase [Deltaproteobacteria bacterium]